MSTADQPPSDQTAPPEWSKYVTIAKSVLSDPIRSRSGFGALRHFGSILSSTFRLVMDSSLVSMDDYGAAPWGGPPLDWWFRHHNGSSRPKILFDTILASPRSYDPHEVWALFWAIARAEHDFLYRFIPFWSHEERLTGHLVAQIVDRVTEHNTHWRSLASDAQRSWCRIAYADTATERQEGLTGADLGLVVHGRFGRQGEFFKVAKFQAKKADWDGNIVVPMKQVTPLLRQEGLGHILAYHPYDKAKWSMAPTVHPMADYSDEIDEESKDPDDTVQLDTSENGFDFASAITFGLADPASELGVLTPTPEQAVRTVMTGGERPPTRILIVTLGSRTSAVDWTSGRLFGEWIRGAGRQA